MTDAEKLAVIKAELEEEVEYGDENSGQRYAQYLLRTFFTPVVDEDQLELPFPQNCS